jgi:hypothetical protein
MAFYEDMAAMAKEMLTEFGTTAVLTNPGSGNGVLDPTARTYTPAAGSSHTVTLAVFDYDEKLVNGTTVLSGDKLAYVAADASLRPRVGATFPWDGKTMKVVAVKPLQPALIAVLWELQVRQ